VCPFAVGTRHLNARIVAFGFGRAGLLVTSGEAEGGGCNANDWREARGRKPSRPIMEL
jgi:hypothetical protein